MKRSKSLLVLSRDHHHGLLLAWKIRQGVKVGADPKVITDYVAWFAKEELLKHFGEEETEVLIHLPDHDTLKQRTLAEHRRITGLISSITANGTAAEEELLSLANHVDDHIRFEERELFPYLETHLTPEQLDQIEQATNAAHRPFCDNFPHEFWKKTT
ncbi:MAG: hemerythrin domain-containing protein [Bacteroidetes bacterium]|nr:hemerythrin domain-containing protein [Bacteroidota bacterium]